MTERQPGLFSGNIPDELRVLFKRKDNPLIKIAVGLAVLGIILLLWPRATRPAVPPSATLVQTQSGTPEQAVPGQSPLSPSMADEAELEQRLASLLSAISGAGSVSVDIRLETQGEARYGANTRFERRTTQEQGQEGTSRTVTEETRSDELVMEKDLQGVETPVMVGQSGPVVGGVVIVADGASDDGVKLALARAAASLLDVPLYRVVVLARERGK